MTAGCQTEPWEPEKIIVPQIVEVTSGAPPTAQVIIYIVNCMNKYQSIVADIAMFHGYMIGSHYILFILN